jgi:hypothetical protein
MKPFKAPAGSLTTEPVSGFDHLPLVPGVADALILPEVRNKLLLLDWEDEAPSVLSVPGGSVYVSKKTADSPIGLAFVAALIRSAIREHRTEQEKENL